jgi:iron-sulfur cluster repair protein YtfE (RIC family)
MTLYDELRQVRVNDQGTNWAECCALVDYICEQYARKHRARVEQQKREALFRRIAGLETEVNRLNQAMGLVVAMAQYERKETATCQSEA